MTGWAEAVRARLVMAQVHLKLREIDAAKKALNAGRAWVPEEHADLRREMLTAETWLWRGDVGKGLAAIGDAIALLDGVGK